MKLSRNRVVRCTVDVDGVLMRPGGVTARPIARRWTAHTSICWRAMQIVRDNCMIIRISEELRGRGYDGEYFSVRGYAIRCWTREVRKPPPPPMSHELRSVKLTQFDWSNGVVLLNGPTVNVKVAHVRLCHSRMLFVRAYPRETHDMMFDTHDRAFAVFKGACVRGIYDNMKTTVDTIFAGKDGL